LSLCRTDQGAPIDATEAAQRAIGLAPDLDLGHYALARALIHRNRFAEAIPPIQEALRLDPYNAAYHGMLSQVHISQRRWADALAAAERGLEVDPENVLCNNLRAMALVGLGRKHEAGQTITASLARDPDDPLTHANQGWTLLEQRQPRQAMEHFREALRLDPNCQWARQGIVEAMKAHHFIYRVMLSYFLWMGKLDSRVQWAIIIGAFFLPRILGSIVKAAPALAPFYWPIFGAYLLFVLMTWIADPLFNLVLRLNRFGRLVLTREQVIASNLLGLGLLTAVGMAVAGIVIPWEEAIICGIYLVLVCLPLSAVFRCDEGWPRWVLAAVTVALAALAFSVLLPENQTPAWVARLLTLFPLAAIGSQFLAIVLSTHQVKR
jgi:tetratricopeptide (TPR) repeat protein